MRRRGARRGRAGRRLMRGLGLPEWGWRGYAVFVLVILALTTVAFAITGVLDAWRKNYAPVFYEPKDFEGELRELPKKKQP